MSDNIIAINEETLKRDISTFILKSIEEILNKLLDGEADELVNADRYERSDERNGYRSGHYTRTYTLRQGDVVLNVPKLKGLRFQTEIFKRFQRRESSIEEALIEMYYAGVSTRRIEDITEALWGSHVSPSTISKLNKEVYEKLEAWRSRKITGKYAYVYVDGTYLKRSWGGEVHNVAILVAIGVNQDGHREIIGVAEGMKEDRDSWRNFFVWLKERGLEGVQLIIGDKNLGMLEVLLEVFPQAKYQRCIVHFYRNVRSVVPKNQIDSVMRMLKAIHSQENKEEALKKAAEVAKKLREMKLFAAAKKVLDGIEETLTYMGFPTQHWAKLRTNNIIERVNLEIKRRTKAVGAFPDGQSALMLVCARLQYVTNSHWGVRRYMDMGYLWTSDAGDEE